MITKKIVHLFICFIVGMFFIIILFNLSDKINNRKNGFIRIYPPHVVSSGQILDIKFNSYYLAGLSNKKIFLGNITAPKIFTCNYGLSDTASYKIKLPLIKTNAPESFQVKIDSPDIYVTNRLSASFYYGKIPDSCRYICSLDSNQFLSATPLSKNSVVIKMYDQQLEQIILKKILLSSYDRPLKKYVLKKYMEGVFSTDGMVFYDKEISRIIYVYYYINRFDVLDTNLNIVYIGKTIDTTSIPKISVAEVPSQQENTMSRPPLVVNKKTTSSSDLLYIISGLAANNEDKNIFNDYSVIDVYKLNTGMYKYSFYIPKYNDKKLSDFVINNNTVIALYDHFLVTYAIKVE